jgi:CubicO group peptidase (beta-lactamase class C family)
MTTSRLYLLVLLSCLTGLLGQPRGLAAQTALSPENERRVESVCAFLTTTVVAKGAPQAHQRDRMAGAHVPGVSIAVIHNGIIEWAQGFGVARLGGPAVTAETLFQAGSISKPVAALAALRLLQQGKPSLDSHVNRALTSWKILPSAAAHSHCGIDGARLPRLRRGRTHSHARSSLEWREARQYRAGPP